MSHTSKMSSNGRVVIPPTIREVLGLADGSTVVFSVTDGKVSLEFVVTGARRARDQLAAALIDKPGISIVEELLADRRTAAARGD